MVPDGRVQCDGYRSNLTRVNKGFLIGAFALKTDIFRKLFSACTSHAYYLCSDADCRRCGLSRGGRFRRTVLPRPRGACAQPALTAPSAMLTRPPQDGRFLVFVEVRRVDEATQVEFDVYQGPGEGANEVINELRAL